MVDYLVNFYLGLAGGFSRTYVLFLGTITGGDLVVLSNGKNAKKFVPWHMWHTVHYFVHINSSVYLKDTVLIKRSLKRELCFPFAYVSDPNPTCLDNC